MPLTAVTTGTCTARTFTGTRLCEQGCGQNHVHYANCACHLGSAHCPSVRVADGDTGLNAAPRHSHREAPTMVIASVVGSGQLSLAILMVP